MFIVFSDLNCKMLQVGFPSAQPESSPNIGKLESSGGPFQMRLPLILRFRSTRDGFGTLLPRWRSDGPSYYKDLPLAMISCRIIDDIVVDVNVTAGNVLVI